jgi:hypothetical protein
MASSAPVKPPIELPTTATGPLAELLDAAREAADRDLLARHVGEPVARQVDRQHATLGRPARDVLEPVVPRAAEAVDVEQRLVVAVVAIVDVVDRAAADLDLMDVLAPVDLAPVGLRGRSVVVAGPLGFPGESRPRGRGEETLAHPTSYGIGRCQGSRWT